MDYLPQCASDFEKIDKMLHPVILKSEKNKKIIMVRERSAVFCAFVADENEEDILNFIKKADFTFSLLLPVVVNMNNGSVRHAVVPLNRSFAKGRALVNLSKLISAIFYEKDNIC